MTPNENQLEALLKLAAQRMGTTPQALKDAANLRKGLSDPEAAKKLLSTPQAQKLLQLLGNQGKPNP